VNAAADRCINLYPEATPGGKEGGFLTRCPCLRLLAAIGTGPIRGMWQFGSLGYVVSGSSLYKIDTAWNATLLGAVNGSGPVTMADNGTQLFIACNPSGFIYNSTTGVFAQITDADFPGAQDVSYLDSYFIFSQPGTQKFWVTSLLDGLAIDPLDFASAEAAPDALVRQVVDHREVWLFGTDSIEIWYDAGLADFPLARIQGAFLEVGCDAAQSVAKLDNSLWWMGGDKRGRGVVYRANGYQGIRVSTEAVEYAIQNYSVISDAIAFTYQQEGHAFYVITFPTEGKCWAYDVSTQKWHERAGFTDGVFTRHRANCQMSFNNTIVVGDFENGNIYEYDLDTYSDNGTIQRWLRSWRALPSGANNGKRTRHNSLEVMCESGVGLVTGQGNDPQIQLRWSDDGGHTWSNYHAKSMGPIGEFGRRIIWRRLGTTNKLRDRVYEISGTDPVKISIIGAELDVTQSTS
jgi:hypothetical protein